MLCSDHNWSSPELVTVALSICCVITGSHALSRESRKPQKYDAHAHPARGRKSVACSDKMMHLTWH